MNIVSDNWHVGTVLKVLGVGRGIVTDVLRRSTAQEGMFDAWSVGNVEVDNAFMDAFVLDKV